MEENDSPSSAITIPCLNDRDAGGGFSSSISNWSRSFKTSVLFDPLTTTDIDHNTPDRQSTTVIREEGRPLLAKEISLKDEETLLYRKSSLNQSIFNSVNVLMGVGVLSLPFAFRLSGWFFGFFFLILFCSITRYTATLLARCMDHTLPETGKLAQNYSDMGQVAFGYLGRAFISIVFLTELFAASCALVILISDSIVALFPAFDPINVKTVVVLLVLPSTWPKSLSFLAYGSVLGLIALVNLISIILYDGFTTTESPGSLINPAPTTLLPPNLMACPMSFGLIMSGLSGHSVLPQIYRDMETPALFPKMVNISYLAVLFLYVVVGSAGYAMFGSFTLQEISQNLALVPTYNSILTQFTIWLIAVNPATKYALTLKPVSSNLEQFVHQKFPSLEGYYVVRIASSTICSFLILLTAIYVPGFHNVMSLLGSLFAFIVSVIFPCCCHLKLNTMGAFEKTACIFLIVFGSIVGSIGTVWSFWSVN